MADVYAAITEAEPAVVERIAEVLELRAADPRQQALRAGYLTDLTLPEGAHVLEIGCGTGPVTRSIAGLEAVTRAVGLDPSPTLLEHARRLSREHANVEFHTGDARALPFADRDFDAVANGPADPLQAVAEACVAAIVHDPLIIHRLAGLVRRAGFTVRHFRTHGYDGVLDPTYLLTIIDRGADALLREARIGPALAQALRDEARRRAKAGEFFGHITYASLIGVRG